MPHRKWGATFGPLEEKRVPEDTRVKVKTGLQRSGTNEARCHGSTHPGGDASQNRMIMYGLYFLIKLSLSLSLSLFQSFKGSFLARS
jgi:hypothetical protein